MKRKMHPAHWFYGLSLSLLLFVAWSNTGVTVNIGLVPEGGFKDNAFQELAIQIARNPWANKFSIRGHNIHFIDSKSRVRNSEIYYNRLARIIKITTYQNPNHPSVTCYGARDRLIDATAFGHISWTAAISQNGGHCDSYEKPID